MEMSVVLSICDIYPIATTFNVPNLTPRRIETTAI